MEKFIVRGEVLQRERDSKREEKEQEREVREVRKRETRCVCSFYNPGQGHAQW